MEIKGQKNVRMKQIRKCFFQAFTCVLQWTRSAKLALLLSKRNSSNRGGEISMVVLSIEKKMKFHSKNETSC